MKNKIAKIINDWDSIDLLFFCQNNEYELKLISECIDNNTTIEQLAYAVERIFIESLGDGVFTKNYLDYPARRKKLLGDEK